MIIRYEVWLNGVALSDIDSRILILDIEHSDPVVERKQSRIAGRNGLFTDDLYIGPRSVTITFQLRAYDTQDKQIACQAIEQWAMQGGKLETSDREGQGLMCVCDAPPHVVSVKNWLDTHSVTFTAYSYPFWQENIPNTLTLSGTAVNGSTMRINGTAKRAYVNVFATPSSGTLTSLTVTANDSTMTLQGISVGSGNTLEISYDDNMILRIKSGNTSYLNKRTPASSDDLIAKCGEENTFSFSANTPVQITFSVKGAWL